jgi:hypothetical protein
MDNESGLPGGEMEFRDVTGLFLEAAAGKYLSHLQGFFMNIHLQDMEPDNLLFMENFTLQDAMGALEVRVLSPALASVDSDLDWRTSLGQWFNCPRAT